jgi:hypothetical protein
LNVDRPQRVSHDTEARRAFELTGTTTALADPSEEGAIRIVHTDLGHGPFEDKHVTFVVDVDTPQAREAQTRILKASDTEAWLELQLWELFDVKLAR